MKDEARKRGTPNAGALTLINDPQNGLLTGASIGSVATDVDYTTFAEPSQELTTVNSTDLHRSTYTRDDLGRITTKQEARPTATTTWAYNYDPAGRLQNVIKNGTQHAAYSYDQNGNRTSSTINGADPLKLGQTWKIYSDYLSKVKGYK